MGLCVVFDVDDTLYLEADYVRSGLQAVDTWVRSSRALSGLGGAAWRQFLAGHRGDIFDRALVELDGRADPGLVREMVQVYREHRPNIVLLDDALACLEVLRTRVYLGVVTDGPLASQRSKCEALGLNRWCDRVIATAALGPGLGKPHPKAFLLVQDGAGCAGADCLYVGDNPAKDFVGPRSLGWRTVRVRRRGGLHFNVGSGPDVDMEMPDLAALPGHVLGRLG